MSNVAYEIEKAAERSTHSAERALLRKAAQLAKEHGFGMTEAIVEAAASDRALYDRYRQEWLDAEKKGRAL